MRRIRNLRAVYGSIAILSGVAITPAGAIPVNPSNCAAGHQVAIAHANALFQTAISVCVTTTAPGPALAACIRTAVNAHQSALAAALASLKSCLGVH